MLQDEITPELRLDILSHLDIVQAELNNADVEKTLAKNAAVRLGRKIKSFSEHDD